MTRKILARPSWAAALLCATLFSAPTVAETRYVTDQLEVTMRSGTSTRNAIVRMLKSGAAVEVLGEDAESGYTQVRLASGEEGWVLTRFLVNEPVAREVLPDLQRRFAALREQSSSTSGQLSSSRAELAELEKQRDALQEENQSLAAQLQEVRRKAADVLNIDAQNSQLRNRVTQLEGDNEQLKILNDELSNRRNIEWFVAGGGVLFFGLVLGLVLPRIRWRRRSSWGDL